MLRTFGALFWAFVGFPFLGFGTLLLYAMATTWGFPATDLWEGMGVFAIYLIPSAFAFFGLYCMGVAVGLLTGEIDPEDVSS